MNALNAQMRAELLEAIKRAEAEARVIVLTGGPFARSRIRAMA